MKTLKLIIPALLLLVTFNISSQEVKPIQATTGAFVRNLLFDSQNHMYMTGSVCGRVWINNSYTDKYAGGYQKIIAKLTDDLKFEWLIELDKHPLDAKMINDEIVCIYTNETKEDNTKTVSVELVKYNLNGKITEQIQIFEIFGSRTGLSLTAKIFENGILCNTSWKGDESFVEIENKRLDKKHYSLVYFSKRNFDGSEKWNYRIEGGTDGFTDLRIQNSVSDINGNTYIISYFGHSADVGIAKFSTAEVFPELGSQKLYYNKLFMLKIDSKGAAEKSEIIAENGIEINGMLIDDEGNIYLVGNHKGNDMYADRQEDPRPYIGAKIKGKAFEIESLDDYDFYTTDGFLAKLGNNWELKWMHNFYGTGYNRVRDIKVCDNGLTATGFFSKSIKIDSKTYGETDSENRADGFVLNLDKDGRINNISLFRSPDSNIPSLYTDINQIPVISVSTKISININGREYDAVGHWGGTFIYR
jgi:hypothetical protein